MKEDMAEAEKDAPEEEEESDAPNSGGQKFELKPVQGDDSE